MKQTTRPFILGLSIFSLLVMIGMQTTKSFADDFDFRRQQSADTPTRLEVEPVGVTVETASQRNDTRPTLSGAYIELPDKSNNITPRLAGETCQQLLANPDLDAVEFADGTAEIDPWVPVEDNVYWGKDGTPSNYYLFFQDGDAGDPTPTMDAFGQAIYMPPNLTRIIVEYDTATANPNAGDMSYGNLYTVDGYGILGPLIEFWPVSDTATNNWEYQFVEVTDPTSLNQLEDKAVAFVFDSITDGSGVGEIAYFDFITLTACVESSTTSRLYLPAITHNFGVATAPLCSPPTENPPDFFRANRGSEQTSAVCNSDLSNIDRADYYAFKPTTSGAHTLHLRNLPSGTQWSGMIFIDSAAPDYAPGPTAGDCRIGTPGSGDKSVTCTLSSSENYVIKVSAGGGYSGMKGTYEMQVTSP